MAHGTPLVPIVVPDPYAVAGIVLTWTASGAGAGNSVECTGREILLARNTDGMNPHTVTVDSVNDPFGRTGHITTDTLAANALRCFQLFPTRGWKQTDGLLHITTDDAQVELCVLRLPVDVK